MKSVVLGPDHFKRWHQQLFRGKHNRAVNRFAFGENAEFAGSRSFSDFRRLFQTVTTPSVLVA